MGFRRFLSLFLGFTVFLGAAFTQAGPKAAQPMRGGTFRFAFQELDTLDVHWTGSDPVWEVAFHMFETILALDAKSEPVPNLADWKMLNDGKKIVLTLRKGVYFHNGKEMKAEDVQASLQRWLKYATFGKAAFKDLKSINILDDYTVEINLAAPSPTALIALAYHDQGPYVMPKSVIDAAGNGQVKEYIGTGPYQLVEWLPDRHIRLKRFDRYSALPGGPNGYGGTKYAYFDEMYWIPFSDPMTKVTALTSGDCQAAVLSIPQVAQLQGDPNISIKPTGEVSSMAITFNVKKGIMSNVRMRQAVLASLDMGKIMLACAGDPAYYKLSSSWGLAGTPWANKEGADVYNKPNPDKVKKYLAEAGYKGEPIVFYANSTTPSDQDAAMVIAEQMKQQGFNVDFRIVDWATLTQIRGNPDAYNMWVNGYVEKPDPTILAFIGVGWPGFWESPKKIEIRGKLLTIADPAKRIAAWKEMCKVVWEELPVIKLGEFRQAVAYRKNIEGIPDLPWLRFYWNAGYIKK